MSKYFLDMLAVFISLLALGVSVWQGIYSREHNRLSVRPYLEVSYKVDEYNGIILSNKGTGPAIVKDIKYYGLTGEAATGQNTFETDSWGILSNKSFHMLKYRKVRHYVYNLQDSYVVSPGEKLVLHKFSDGQYEEHRSMTDVIENIKLHVTYGSIYEEEFSSHTGRIKKLFDEYEPCQDCR